MKQQRLEAFLKIVYEIRHTEEDIEAALDEVFLSREFINTFISDSPFAIAYVFDGSEDHPRKTIIRKAAPNPYLIAYDELDPFGEIIDTLYEDDLMEIVEGSLI